MLVTTLAESSLAIFDFPFANLSVFDFVFDLDFDFSLRLSELDFRLTALCIVLWLSLQDRDQGTPFFRMRFPNMPFIFFLVFWLIAAIVAVKWIPLLKVDCLQYLVKCAMEIDIDLRGRS